jgi:hypothetical protein
MGKRHKKSLQGEAMVSILFSFGGSYTSIFVKIYQTRARGITQW